MRPVGLLSIVRVGLFSLGLTAPATASAESNPDWPQRAAAAAALSRETFLGLPLVAQPRVSPDGTKIAFLYPHEGKLVIGVFDRKTKEARLVVQGREESFVTFFWKGNDRLVFLADLHGNESFFIGSSDLTGRRVVRVVETQPGEYLAGSAGGLVDSLPFDPDRVLISGYLRSNSRTDTIAAAGVISGGGGPPTVAKVNIRNRAILPVYTYQESETVFSLIADTAGVLRIRGRIEPAGAESQLVWEYRHRDGQAWREIVRHPFHGYAETWEPQFFARDNETLYLISREEHDRGALYAFNTSTMSRGDALFVPPEGEVTRVLASQNRTKLYGVEYESDRRHQHFFDSGRARLQASVEAVFPGMEVTLSSVSDDEQVCIVHVGSDREPGVYFVLDRTAGSLDQFKRVRELDPALLRPMESVRFTSRDGLEIHGYLTRPWTAEAGRTVPLIIHPHGGPFGVRDSWRFDAGVQFLASRGYAVLQVNYRGSGGYGREFINRGRYQWGRDMQNDLTDAVKWAVAEGIADPDRIAIYGASYGGYATLAGLVFTPDLYRCGVNYVGAADLGITFKARGSDAWRRGDDFDYQERWVGATKEYRSATSPINFIERIRVPTLHAYGAKDPRVEFDHWTRLEAELKRHRKPYEAFIERRQGHGFRNEQASLSFYEAMEKFLAKNLLLEPR
jgi:dipeptidyl aminopeptidase/acylaminoacyl peptidase